LRIAITGATGFIGTHLAASVVARGDVAIPIKRPFDPATLTSTLRLERVDVVVHLAGVVSAVRREAFFAANVDATRVVAHATRDAGARLVLISSLAAAGPAPASSPRSEDDEPRPITAYGESKLQGEQVVRGLDGLRWTILRPGVVYGPADRAMLPLFRYAQRGVLPLVGDAGAAYTFIYIDDAVGAILAAVDCDRTGDVMFLGHPRPVTPRDLLSAIKRVTGSSARLIGVPRPLVRLAALFGDVAGRLSGRPATITSRRYAELYSPGFVCRVERLRDRLGVVAAVDVPEGLARTMAWYVANGWVIGNDMGNDRGV
jgi:nucleoside-diphosphate-sugar epimerase